ncbi:DUF3558 domain-containing protein [Amycolatopsis acidicola]|uniref:DUF3558 domain-containing protein n=2 Tax=Amycolatopsis acidicola TaxID=2596893 RepID=A0A5N0UUL1_9PSEU|nr:DUF3558 domain-containing protein [Amycolatopsis acidicola]
MAAGALAAGALLTGCGAQAAPTGSDAPTVAAAGPSPSATGLAALAPCELLTPVERSTVGLTSAGTDKAIGSGRACDWTETGTFGLTITLEDAAGLDDLQVGKGGGKTTVGEHQAIKVSDRSAGDGTCAMLLAAGDKSSVQIDVTNSNFHDTTLACQRAQTVAKLVEPKLP